MIDRARLEIFDLFADFDDASMDAFARATTERVLAPGEVVFRIGDEGGDLFLVETGLVEVVLESLEERHGMARLGPGTFFGEVGMLSRGPRTATVMAMQPTTLLVMHQTPINALIDSSHIDSLRFSRRLGVAMAYRARSTS